jgi:hypothetical protein
MPPDCFTGEPLLLESQLALAHHPERINNIEDTIPYPAHHTHFIDGGQYVSFLMRESPDKRNH